MIIFNKCFLFVFRVGAKLAVGGGALYYTLDKGVWSTNTDTNKLIDEVQNTVLQDTKKYLQTVSKNSMQYFP